MIGKQIAMYNLKCEYFGRKVSYGLKLLFLPLWILIPKIKTNKNKQQYFTDNAHQ